MPKPFWCYPTWHETEEVIDIDELLAKMHEERRIWRNGAILANV
jgi:hypothetical protein